MAEELAEQKPKLFGEILTEYLEEHKEALPKYFNSARFVQNALALINDNPALKKYPKTQLATGMMKAAYLGLDFYSKEAYLIPYGDSLNFQIDYRGAKKLAKKYSIRPIKDIYAEIVREGDLFEKIVEDGNTKIKFQPKPFSDAKIIGAFAVVVYADGGCQCDTMTLAELEKTRSKSKAKNSMAWADFTAEMYKKTVLHRLCKHIEIDFENPTQMDLWQDSNSVDTNIQAAPVDNPFGDDDADTDVIDVESREV